MECLVCGNKDEFFQERLRLMREGFTMKDGEMDFDGSCENFDRGEPSFYCSECYQNLEVIEDSCLVCGNSQFYLGDDGIFCPKCKEKE